MVTEQFVLIEGTRRAGQGSESDLDSNGIFVGLCQCQVIDSSSHSRSKFYLLYFLGQEN